MKMEFTILGTIEVADSGARISLAPQQLRLLGILVINLNRVVSTEVIVTALLGRRPTAAARRTAQMAVARLRKSLEGSPHVRLITVSGGYELAADPDRVDLFRAVRTNGSIVATRFTDAPDMAPVALDWLDTVFGSYTTAPMRTMAATRIRAILAPQHRFLRPTLIS
jgi:DNA-binding winged helix-turn-helix (wHTH) protein